MQHEHQIGAHRSPPAELTRRRGSWPARLLAAIVLLVVATLVLGGGQLVLLGGSWFCLLHGAALLVAAILLWARHRTGAAFLILMALPTLLWAFWEAGLDAWALLPKIWLALLLAGLGALLLLDGWKRRTALLAGSLALIVAAVAVLSHRSVTPLSARANASLVAGSVGANGEWRNVARSPGADRFSELAQINPANAGGLKLAWSAPLGMRSGAHASPITYRSPQTGRQSDLLMAFPLLEEEG